MTAADIVRPARAGAIALLERAGLPYEDVTDALLEHFFAAGDPQSPLGIVGLELSPPHALLRSLAVEPQARSRGLGSLLLAHAEAHARSHGVHTLYLLTTGAERYFAARGFERADRAAAPHAIRASAQLAELCPASAVFMVKHLPEKPA